MMLEHVVIVTDSLSVDGGSAKVALASAAALARSGMPVSVFSAAGEPAPELLACDGLRVVCTGQGESLASKNRLAGAVRGLWNRRAAREMRALLATLDPAHTVVHVHSWTKALSSSVVAAAVKANFPVLVTLHEYFTACPTGCLYLHRDNRVCRLAPMSFACVSTNCDSRNYLFKLYRVVRQLISCTAGSIPDGIGSFITVSPFSRAVLEPVLPANSRFYAVDNPVDAEFGPRISAETNRPFVFVGRLSSEKGGVLLAEAARRAGVPVVFVGEGPDRAEIERVYPDARTVGWLDRGGVAAALREARCLVVPSLWYETFGLVVLEAAALGVPSIVPAGTAAGDLVVDETNGLVFERGDVASLAAQLERCTDDGLVERLSRAAYDAFWRDPHSMQSHIVRLVATYRDVLGTAVPAKRAA